jgi:hypothetical protein
VERKLADPPVKSSPDNDIVDNPSKESKGDSKRKPKGRVKKVNEYNKSPKRIVAQIPVAKIPYIPYRVSFEGIIRSTKDLLYNTPVVNVQSMKNNQSYIDSKRVGAAFFNKYYNRLSISTIVSTKKINGKTFRTKKNPDITATKIQNKKLFEFFSGFGAKKYFNSSDITKDENKINIPDIESMPYFYFRSFIKKFDKNDIILRKLFEISSLCFASIYKVANDAKPNKPKTTNDVLVLEDIDVSTDTDKSKPITTIQSLLVNTGIYRKLKTISKSVQAAFPNLGFHNNLVRLALGQFLRHPLNPLPMMKW